MVKNAFIKHVQQVFNAGNSSAVYVYMEEIGILRNGTKNLLLKLETDWLSQEHLLLLAQFFEHNLIIYSDTVGNGQPLEYIFCQDWPLIELYHTNHDHYDVLEPKTDNPEEQHHKTNYKVNIP